MRTSLSIIILQLTAMVSVAAIAVAQTEVTSTPPVPVVQPEDEDAKRIEDGIVASDAKQDGEVIRTGSTTFASLLKRLDDVYSLAEKIESEIEKIDKRHKNAASSAPVALAKVNDPPKSPQVLSDTAKPSPPEATLPALDAPAKAEVDIFDSFDSVAGDTIPTDATGDYIDTMPIPVLNGSTPDWVKNGLVMGEDHSFAISSTLMPDLEQCREDLKSRMMADVRVYLDKHVLQLSEASLLPELTQDYVEKYWVKKGQVFDNVQDRPSGTYHQLWIGLHISSEQLSKIREWEKQTVREQRTRKVGVFGGIGVCAITLLSGAVGLLARREKAKLKG